MSSFLSSMRQRGLGHDATIAGYAHEEGRAVIICVNKWDAVEDKDKGSSPRTSATSSSSSSIRPSRSSPPRRGMEYRNSSADP